ncbi:hypothetical protein SESBI_32649 [Sesbania bispinosa]|nr:hypothetical protein SESBI_32649 [Sesbania bispinosa]
MDMDMNLLSGSGHELSDLVAQLDQVEGEIRRLSESRIKSELEVKQERLARLKTILDEIENRLEQSRQMDMTRDQEQTRQHTKLYSQMEPLSQRLATRRQALEGVQNALQLQLCAQDLFLQEAREGSTFVPLLKEPPFN